MENNAVHFGSFLSHAVALFWSEDGCGQLKTPDVNRGDHWDDTWLVAQT